MCESYQRVLIARPPHDAVASATTASTRASRTPDRCQARLATAARPTSRQPRPALGEYMPDCVVGRRREGSRSVERLRQGRSLHACRSSSGCLTRCRPVGVSPWCGSREGRVVLRIRGACHGSNDRQEDPVMDVMIGVDPHKGSHTATMLDRAERELRRITVRAGWSPSRASCSSGPTVSSRGRGQWSPPAGWAICCPSSSSPPARRCSMCRRRWRRGCGCWALASRPRAIRTMPARSPSLRCGRPSLARCGGPITSTVCRLLVKHHNDLARWRNKLCCRLHALVGRAGARRDQQGSGRQPGTITARRDRARRRGGRRAAPSSGRARR